MYGAVGHSTKTTGFGADARMLVAAYLFKEVSKLGGDMRETEADDCGTFADTGQDEEGNCTVYGELATVRGREKGRRDGLEGQTGDGPGLMYPPGFQ